MVGLAICHGRACHKPNGSSCHVYKLMVGFVMWIT